MCVVSPNSARKSQQKSSAPVIAGVVVGLVIAVLMILLIIFIIIYMKKRHRSGGLDISANNTANELFNNPVYSGKEM